MIELDEEIGTKIVAFMIVNLLQRDLNRNAWSVVEAKEMLGKGIMDKAL